MGHRRRQHAVEAPAVGDDPVEEALAHPPVDAPVGLGRHVEVEVVDRVSSRRGHGVAGRAQVLPRRRRRSSRTLPGLSRSVTRNRATASSFLGGRLGRRLLTGLRLLTVAARRSSSRRTGRRCRRSATSGSHGVLACDRQVGHQLAVGPHDAGGVLGPLDVPRRPVDPVGDPRQQHQYVPQPAPRSTIHVSLLPPPCDELTTSEPFGQRDPGQPAGRDVARLAGEDERAQVDVARLDAVGRTASGPSTAAGSAGRPSCAGRPRSPRPAGVELGVGGPVADEDAVAAALVGRLDDELAQVVEHEPALVVVEAAVRRHVRRSAAPRRR